MRHALVLTRLLTATLALASCSDVTGPSDVPITSVEWRLRSLQQAGGDPISIASPEKFTLTLEESGDLGVRADCNRCFGNYELGAGGSIQFGEAMGCTLAFCQSAPLDTDYTQLLLAMTRYEATAEQLTLSSDAGTLRFTR